MKAIVVNKPNDIEIKEYDMPKIQNGNEVLIKIKAAGICTSDIHILHGTNPMVDYPRIIGHEIVGIIERVGPDVTKVKTGDHVIVDQIKPCGKCYPCSIGRLNVCCNLRVRGVNIDGGYREYMVVDEGAVYILPDELPFAEAIMIEPMSIAFQAVSRAGIKDNDIVLVMGAGSIGTSIIKAVALTKAKIIAADIFDERLEEAKRNGAHMTINAAKVDLVTEVKRVSGGYGPTASFDAVGSPDGLQLLARASCNAGRIITLAFLEEPSKISQLYITTKELDIRGTRLQNNKFPDVIDAYMNKRIYFDGLVSHQVPFTEVKEAFKMLDAKDKSVKKVALIF